MGRRALRRLHPDRLATSHEIDLMSLLPNARYFDGVVETGRPGTAIIDDAGGGGAVAGLKISGGGKLNDGTTPGAVLTFTTSNVTSVSFGWTVVPAPFCPPRGPLPFFHVNDSRCSFGANPMGGFEAARVDGSIVSALSVPASSRLRSDCTSGVPGTFMCRSESRNNSYVDGGTPFRP